MYYLGFPLGGTIAVFLVTPSLNCCLTFLYLYAHRAGTSVYCLIQRACAEPAQTLTLQKSRDGRKAKKQRPYW